jgi:hypothetical protein
MGGGWKMEVFCLTECGDGPSVVLAGKDDLSSTTLAASVPH